MSLSGTGAMIVPTLEVLDVERRRLDYCGAARQLPPEYTPEYLLRYAYLDSPYMPEKPCAMVGTGGVSHHGFTLNDAND